MRRSMNSRVLNNRLRQAYGRGFRLHTPCFLNDCYTNGMARMENVSSQQKLQLLPAGGSMPAALSDQDAPRAHIPHYHGENLSKTLGDIKRLVSGCTLRWNSKPLDDEHAFSPVFLGHTKFSARYLNTSASAVSTRPAGSCARHSRALSTSSGETVKEKEGRMSTDQEREVDVSEADDGMSGATVQEPKNTPVEMPKITDEDRVGNITSWSHAVGDHVKSGEAICEIELEQFSAAVNVDTDGYIAKILVPAGSENVAIGTVLAVLVHAEEDVAFYQKGDDGEESSSIEDAEGEAASEAVHSFSWKDVLKAVSRLREDEKLSEESASTLMSLARKKDVELLKAFEGCYEGDVYQGEIDDDLFVVQARDIANQSTIVSQKEREQETSETVNNENNPRGTPKAD